MCIRDRACISRLTTAISKTVRSNGFSVHQRIEIYIFSIRYITNHKYLSVLSTKFISIDGKQRENENVRVGCIIIQIYYPF